MRKKKKTKARGIIPPDFNLLQSDINQNSMVLAKEKKMKTQTNVTERRAQK